NLGHNSIIYMLESKFDYVLKCIQAVEKKKARSIDVKQKVMRRYNLHIQEQICTTVWQSGCTSWYQNESGKNTNNCPTFTLPYRPPTENVTIEDYHFDSA